MMAELKTKQTDESVDAFLSAIADEKRKEDCYSLLALMSEVTGKEPRLWNNNTIGFGTYGYKTKSGCEGEWYVTGFSPRKQNLTLYIMSGFQRYDELMSKLGKFKTGKSCLYLKRLEDVDQDVLTELVKQSADYISKTTT